MAKTGAQASRRRLTLGIPSALRRRIEKAAADDLSLSVYVARLLDRAVPPLKKTDGTISRNTLRRFAALRAEQREPFPEDSADLIRQIRSERESQL